MRGRTDQLYHIRLARQNVQALERYGRQSGPARYRTGCSLNDPNELEYGDVSFGEEVVNFGAIGDHNQAAPAGSA